MASTGVRIEYCARSNFGGDFIGKSCLFFTIGIAEKIVINAQFPHLASNRCVVALWKSNP